MANNAAKKKTTTKKNTATKKSSSSGKKTASAKKTTSSASAPRKTTRGGSHSDRAKNAQSNNRVIAGIVCLLLALISALGYFHIEAILVEWIRTLIGGLTGWGFYLFPPCLFMVAYLLMHYRNTPLTGRIVALLLIPVLFGAMAQLLFSMTDLGAAGGLASIISILFNDGRQLAYGGVISGLLAYGLEKIISIYGAFPVLLLAFIYFVLRSFNITISQIMEWANSKEQPVSIREKIENKDTTSLTTMKGISFPMRRLTLRQIPRLFRCLIWARRISISRWMTRMMIFLITMMWSPSKNRSPFLRNGESVIPLIDGPSRFPKLPRLHLPDLPHPLRT